MVRLSLLACALVVCGCKGKSTDTQRATGSGSGSAAKAPPTPPLDSLSVVDGAGPKVALDTLAGQVILRDNGTLTLVGDTADLSIDALVKKLGLPLVARRQAPALTQDGSGSDDASSATDSDKQFALLGHPSAGAGVPAPAPRLTTAFALAHPFDVSAGVLVWASPAAPASVLVDVLHSTGGFVAVKRGTDVGAIAFAFDRQEPPAIAPTKPWLEMHLGKPGEVGLVPGAPMPLDANKLADIVKGSAQGALDILVAPDSSVGDLVHAIELARTAGVVAIGLGRAPATGSIEQTSRAPQGPRVVAWDFFMQGMDKTNPEPFEKALDATLQPIHDCYAKLVAKSKDLGGTAQVELMLAATGKVGELQTSGVDKALGACVGDALGKATFPAVAMPIKLTTQLAFLPH